jgi:hypothetical protein
MKLFILNWFALKIMQCTAKITSIISAILMRIAATIFPTFYVMPFYKLFGQAYQQGYIFPVSSFFPTLPKNISLISFTANKIPRTVTIIPKIPPNPLNIPNPRYPAKPLKKQHLLFPYQRLPQPIPHPAP